MVSGRSAFFLGVAALATAHPTVNNDLLKRAMTPDNTCGGARGYTCNPGDSFGGPCCSASGFCGKTSDYCGSGCQSAFGSCGSAAPVGGSGVNKVGCTWDVPGAGRFTEFKTFDFNGLSALPAGLGVSTDSIGAGAAPYSQLYTTSNVVVSGNTLQLIVPGGQTSSPIRGAEVFATDRDILYGSVRTTAMLSSVPGTCHGFFFYKNDNQESDIEVLTDPRSKAGPGAHYTNQALRVGDHSTTAVHPLSNAATSTFHEYRLDWMPGRTMFYLDGVLQHTLTDNVPNVPTEWIINNWSNGDIGWSAGPPPTDNVLKISKIVMYYNTTSSATRC